MRRSLAILAVLGLGAAGVVAVGVPAAEATVPVPGSHPRWAVPAARVGAAPASEMRTVDVFLRSRNASALTAAARAVSDPHSPAYGHYLTTAQVETQFAPSAATVRLVRSWLAAAGLHTAASTGNTYVAATGTNDQLAQAFKVQLARYRTNGRVLIGADRAADVPASIASSVLGIVGLSQTFARSDVVPPPPGFRNAPPCGAYFGEKVDTTDPPFDGQQLPYVPCGYQPGQLRSAFGLQRAVDAGVDGAGVTVAILDAFGSPTLLSDAQSYATHNDPSHPLTAAQFAQQVDPPTPGLEDPDQCNAAGWYTEQSLDVEAVHAAAPGASIFYRGSSDCTDASLFGALDDIVTSHSADIVSNSWGSVGEDLGTDLTTFDEIAQRAAVEGIGLYFSSGDAGDESQTLGQAEPDFPASDPWVTAVGGTSLGIDSTGGINFLSGWEQGRSTLSSGAWSTPVWISGAGGGTSRQFTEPDFQQGVVPPALAQQNRTDGTSGRVVPDLASVADSNTGMLIGLTQTFPEGAHYDQFRVGGTSLAAPVVAGTMALADQLVGRSHGFLDPSLYEVAYPGGAITDVLHGSGALARVDYANGVDAADGLVTTARSLDFDAQSLQTTGGYDDVTGLGVLNGGAVALRRITVTPSTATTAAGTPIAFTTTATDAFGAARDVSVVTTLSIAPTTVGASCTATTCTATAAGQYTVTASYAGSLPTTGPLTSTAALTVTPAAAATITATGGTPQSATSGSTFADPLQATVTDVYGNPVPGVPVTFTLPASSPTTGGATFPGGVRTATAMTNSSGVATSPTITAGPQTGPIIATASSGSLTPAEYTLTVTAPPPAKADLVVNLSAPSTARPGSSQTITLTITNNGPSAATRVGGAVLVPRDWIITAAPGGTVYNRQLAFFTAASLAKGASVRFTLTVTTSSKKGLALIAGVGLSGTSDPNYRNNVAAAIVQLR